VQQGMCAPSNACTSICVQVFVARRLSVCMLTSVHDPPLDSGTTEEPRESAGLAQQAREVPPLIVMAHISA